MKKIKAIKEWNDFRNAISDDISIGFVPTMGALHAGHASLIQQARKENDIVIVSVFVNPTQFNDVSDYEHYPKNLDVDVEILTQLNVDAVFVPDAKEIYPSGNIFSIQPHLEIAEKFEGASRPGHFAGMLTVVMKLLNIVKPTRMYMGEKDYQQAQLIQHLVRDFFIESEIIICPIVREPSGLPLSSRNQRLSIDERVLADQAFELIQQTTPEELPQLKQTLTNLGCDVDYLEIYQGRVFSAIRIGDVRLIDNFSDSLTN